MGFTIHTCSFTYKGHSYKFGYGADNRIKKWEYVWKGWANNPINKKKHWTGIYKSHNGALEHARGEMMDIIRKHVDSIENKKKKQQELESNARKAVELKKNVNEMENKLENLEKEYSKINETLNETQEMKGKLKEELETCKKTNEKIKKEQTELKNAFNSLKDEGIALKNNMNIIAEYMTKLEDIVMTNQKAVIKQNEWEIIDP
jgi:chromosome segregation ATPase